MPPKSPGGPVRSSPAGAFCVQKLRKSAYKQKTGERKSFHLFFIFGGIHNGKKRNLWKRLNFFENLDGGGLNR